MVVRVNPDFELKSSGMRMGGGAKQFGIDAERVPRDAGARLGALGLDFQGFHIFSGSQSLKADALHGGASQTASRWRCGWRSDAPQPVRQLNIGGGFGIPYFPGEAAARPGGGRRQPGAADAASAAQRLPGAQVAVELGRYLVGEAGVYVARVVDRKVSRGQVFLVTDGGLHHHLSASGNFGQVIRKNYPVAIGNRDGAAAQRETVSVVGPLCTPLDLLADRWNWPRPTWATWWWCSSRAPTA